MFPTQTPPYVGRGPYNDRGSGATIYFRPRKEVVGRDPHENTEGPASPTPFDTTLTLPGTQYGAAGLARVPVFVVTHAGPEEVPEGGVYTFVTDGIEEALEQARAAAGDKDVAVMGGADKAPRLTFTFP